MLKASYVYSKQRNDGVAPFSVLQVPPLRERRVGDEVNLSWSPENNRHEAGASRWLKNLDSVFCILYSCS